MWLHMLVSYLTLVLVTLSIGYLVLVFANKEKKGMKTAGQVIGWGIIVLTILSVLGSGFFMATGKGMLGCKMMGQKTPMKMMMRK